MPGTAKGFNSWPLHDGVLKSIHIGWESRVCRLALSAFLEEKRNAVDCIITFEGVIDVEIPHRTPWGESVFVNEQHLDGDNTYVIVMQSGDEIRITANSARLSNTSGTA
jgi:hypothetical protein